MSDKRLIDAEELKATLIKWFPPFTLEGLEAKTLFKQIIRDIDNAPTVEPSQNAEHDALQYSKGYQAGFLEAKKLHGETEGEWLDNVFIGGYVCNNCNAGYSSNPKSAFCPICGAKMKNGQVPEVLARRKQSETNGGQPHE